MRNTKNLLLLTRKALFILIFSVLLPCCQSDDNLYEFFKNAELQYETESQKESIITALNDILNFDLSVEELKNKKYSNYTGEENQWDLPTLVNRYFVSEDKNNTFSIKMYKQLRNKRIYDTIEEIIRELISNEQITNFPYILELKDKEKQLVVYGCNHSFNPKDTMFIDIEKQFLKLNPKAVLNEGGNWPIFNTKEETILKSGEQGFVRYLCNKNNIQVKTFEPNPKQEFEFILSKYKKDDVLLMYFCRQIVQLQNNQQTDNFKTYIIGFLNNLKHSGFPIEDIEDEYDVIVKSYEQILKEKFDWKTFNPENVWPNYDNTILNTINKDISEFRDKHILELIDIELNKHKVIFVIMGKDHLLKQEDEIKEML